MGDITHADLIAVQNHITTEVRRDIRECRKDLTGQIRDVKEIQEGHGTRLDAQGAEIRELRTVLDERTRATSLLELTPKQKKLLWTAAAGVGAASLEGFRHIGGWVLAWMARGVPAP